MGEKRGRGEVTGDGEQWHLRARVGTSMRIMACSSGMDEAVSGACRAPLRPGHAQAVVVRSWASSRHVWRGCSVVYWLVDVGVTKGSSDVCRHGQMVEVEGQAVQGQAGRMVGMLWRLVGEPKLAPVTVSNSGRCLLVCCIPCVRRNGRKKETFQILKSAKRH